MSSGSWTAIAELARKQGGYVTRKQLLAKGLSGSAIDSAIRTGRLIRVYVGVYAVGHLPAHPQERAQAALLACGSQAALCHGSGATLWGMYRWWSMPYEVTIPGDRRRAGIKIHRAQLTCADVTTQLGLRVTSPARTVLDMAPRLTPERLIRAANNLYFSGYLRRPELLDVVTRFPRHPGARLLRPILADKRGPTRTELEDAFKRLIDSYGLPSPRFNVTLGRRTVDALYEQEGVIIELDSWQFHRSRAAFENDRDRDADHILRELATVRVTWERMMKTPRREAARLERILSARRDSRRRGLSA